MPSPIALSELSLLIQEALRRRFQQERYWVLAEISNHSFYPQKGFHYFDLVEKAGSSLKAKIPAVAWSPGAMQIAAFERTTQQKFQAGIAVCIEVTVEYHSVYGLKATLQHIDPAYTLGQLALARQQVIYRLLQEEPDTVWLEDDQLCSFNQQLALPPVLQKLAVVGSLQSAGLEDFRHSLLENPYGYAFDIDYFDTRVQGEEQAAALAATFSNIGRRSLETGLDYDAIALIRGGGASTDLLLFDQYETALAVASAPFPVFTGIGHQKDRSLADLLAFTSLKTPTQVAETILQQNRHFELSLQQTGAALLNSTRERLQQARLALTRTRSALSLQPVRQLHTRLRQLGQLRAALPALGRTRFKTERLQLDAIRRLLLMASPEKSLERGFAWIEKEGKLITDPAALNTGDSIRIRLKNSIIHSHVEQKTASDGPAFNL
ncbi:MAG: exodeoxyribonuclease VII large subunit [Flavihumibacter sp.]